MQHESETVINAILVKLVLNCQQQIYLKALEEYTGLLCTEQIKMFTHNLLLSNYLFGDSDQSSLETPNIAYENKHYGSNNYGYIAAPVYKLVISQLHNHIDCFASSTVEVTKKSKEPLICNKTLTYNK